MDYLACSVEYKRHRLFGIFLKCYRAHIFLSINVKCEFLRRARKEMIHLKNTGPISIDANLTRTKRADSLIIELSVTPSTFDKVNLDSIADRIAVLF